MKVTTAIRRRRVASAPSRFRKLPVAGPPAVRRGLRKGYHGIRWLSSKLLPVLCFAVAGLFLANGIQSSAPQSIAGMILGLVGLGIVFWRFELGIVAVMAIVASIIYAAAIPKPFTVAGQGFTMVEVLVLWLVLVALIRRMGQRSLDFLASPVAQALLAFFAAVAIKTFVSYINQPPAGMERLDFREIYLSGPRDMVLYVFYFAVAFGIRTRRQLEIVLRAVVWIASIVGILMVVQYLMGSRGTVYIGAGAERLFTKNKLPGEEDIVRSLPPGLGPVLLVSALATIHVCHVGIRKGWVAGLASLATGLGLVFSFTRTIWIAAAVGFIIAAVMVGRRVGVRIAAYGLATAALVVVMSLGLGQLGGGSAGMNFGKTLNERVVSIFDPKLATGGENRVREDRNAIRLIKQNPVWGVPLGHPFEYRFVQVPNRVGIVPYRYIHNGYLGIYLRYGVLGLASILALSAIFLWRCFKMSRTFRNARWRSLSIALFVAYVFMMINAVTNGVLDNPAYICTVTLIWGLGDVLWRLQRHELDETDVPSESVKKPQFAAAHAK